jgi:hypothetical protein
VRAGSEIHDENRRSDEDERGDRALVCRGRGDLHVSTTGTTGRHEAPEQDADRPSSESFAETLRDAIAPRTLLLVVGTGLLTLAFLLSYLGAFHDPKPHDIPFAVVAPAGLADQLVAGLNDIDGHPLDVTAVADEATARERIQAAELSGALVVDTSGTEDRLLVAGGGGTTTVSALQQILTAAEAQQQRTLAVEDVVPSQDGDGVGAAGFYVVISCVLAGYLLAATLGMAKGSRPATFRRSLFRLGATVPYAVLVGLGAAVITDPVLGALTGHFAAVWGIGALLVLAAATVTMAFQILLGFFGIAATILVFVVIGNPSAGGAYPYPLLPPFLSSIGPWLPNGAGVDALRRITYFDGVDVASRIWVIVVWALAGALVAVLAAAFLERRARSAASA